MNRCAVLTCNRRPTAPWVVCAACLDRILHGGIRREVPPPRPPAPLSELELRWLYGDH